MALDIAEGDYLVVGSLEYPIRSCAPWPLQTGRSNPRRYISTASTKRQPAIVSGKRGDPVTNLTCIRCTPLLPIDGAAASEIRQRLALDTPYELLQVFADGSDTVYHLVVEDLKR